MNKALITRTKKLIDAVPDDQLEEYTILSTKLIVERNKVIIKNFDVGDDVSWMQSKGNEINGVIKKINAASASVITDDNWQWDVPAHQLKKQDFLKG